MNIPSIQGIGQNIKKGVDTVGSGTIDVAKNVKEFASTQLGKLKDTKLATDVVEIGKKAGKFVKTNKNTIVGAGVLVAATGLAIAAVKTIVDKVKEVKEQK